MYICVLFSFNDTATTEIYTLSLHDALPISSPATFRTRADLEAAGLQLMLDTRAERIDPNQRTVDITGDGGRRSEEHTSELQSQSNLVCRLLLEKKKKKINYNRNMKKDNI